MWFCTVHVSLLHHRALQIIGDTWRTEVFSCVWAAWEIIVPTLWQADYRKSQRSTASQAAPLTTPYLQTAAASWINKPSLKSELYSACSILFLEAMYGSAASEKMRGNIIANFCLMALVDAKGYFNCMLIATNILNNKLHRLSELASQQRSSRRSFK